MGFKRKISLAFFLGFVLLFQTVTLGNYNNVSAQTEVTIPEWIKETAKFWADGSVDDTTFVNSFEWLFKNGIIQTSELTIVDSESDDISGRSVTVPEWVKNNARFWTDGLIGDSDFASGITFLYKEGIVISPTVIANPCPEITSEESIFDLLIFQNILGLAIPNFMAFAEKTPCLKEVPQVKSENTENKVTVKISTSKQVIAGKWLDYKIHVKNNGPDLAFTTFQFVIPEQVSLRNYSYDHSKGCNQEYQNAKPTNKIICEPGPLKNSEELKLNIFVTTSKGTKANTELKFLSLFSGFTKKGGSINTNILQEVKTLVTAPCIDVKLDKPSLQLDFILPFASGDELPCPEPPIKIVNMQAKLIKDPIIGEDPMVEFSYKVQFQNGEIAKNYPVLNQVLTELSDGLYGYEEEEFIDTNNFGEIRYSVLALPDLKYHFILEYFGPLDVIKSKRAWIPLVEPVSIEIEDFVITKKSATFEETSSIKKIGDIYAEYEITWLGYPFTEKNFPKSRNAWFNNIYLKVIEPSPGVDSTRLINGYDMDDDGDEDFIIRNALSETSYDVILVKSNFYYNSHVLNSELTIETTPDIDAVKAISSESETDEIKVIDKGITLNQGSISGFFKVVEIRDGEEFPYAGETLFIIKTNGKLPYFSYYETLDYFYDGTTDNQGLISFEYPEAISGKTYYFWVSNQEFADKGERIEGGELQEEVP